MKVLGMFTWIAISSLVTALVQSWTMQCLWRWFIAREYGVGPSLGAWFGIAIIGGLTLRTQVSGGRGREDRSADQIIKASVVATGVRWLECLLVLAVTWCIGSVLGWIP